MNASPRLMGIETEYAVLTPETNGARADRRLAAIRLLELAASRYPHLPGLNDTGLFLANGTRFYIDAGGHPEYCTPEVDNPWDVVRYTLAGDRFLAGLAEELSREGPLWFLSRCNVDYSGAGSTWACHESYGHRASGQNLSSFLVPHLVSRIVFAGAGGINPLRPGIEFCLSPRACHITRVISESSTANRGIFHTKNEPLSCVRGWRRCHILTGESLASQLAALLKVGTTALVIALVDAGLAAVDEVRLAHPLLALQTFNADPACRATALLQSGREITAVELQRLYLEQVRRHVDNPQLPSWAGRICALWQRVLNALGKDPNSLHQRLDWPLQQAILTRQIKARGLTQESLAAGNAILAGLRLPENEPMPPPSRTAAALEDPAGPYAGCLPELTEALARHGLSSDHLHQVLSLRARVAEIITRTAALGPDNPFTRMQQSRLLRHTVSGIRETDITRALRQPPSTPGRARVRGELIARLARERPGCRSDWSGVWDEDRQHRLDLADPHVTTAPEWSRIPPGAGPHGLATPDPSEVVLELYARGEYQAASTLLDTLGTGGATEPGQPFPDLLTCRFWVETRRGFAPAARCALEARAAAGLAAAAYAIDRVALHRFSGLLPEADIWLWIRKAEEYLGAGGTLSPIQRATLAEHKGRALVVSQQTQAARSTLEAAVAEPRLRSEEPRIHARILGDLADVCRVAGEPDRARACLEDAAQLQREGGFEGDYADFNLTQRAKLEYRETDVRPWLDSAEVIQRGSSSRMGLARTLLLRARLFPASSRVEPIRLELGNLQDAIPALRTCPFLQRILNRWDAWLSGQPPGWFTRDFFGGL